MGDRSKGVYEGSAVGGDTSSFSRTWDKAAYEKRAVLRMAGQLPTQKQQKAQDQSAQSDELGSAGPQLISARNADLGFTSAVGKTTIVQTSDGSQPGFHCDVCDRTYKDNMGFLDHINSIQHLQAKGHIMRTERSTVEQVKARLLFHKLAKENTTTRDFKAERLKRQQKEEHDRIEKRENKKRLKEDNKKAKLAEENANVDGDMAAMMGFGGFGSTKPGGKK
ncbi:hypothetical protein BDEG_24728 [Batrachochytrium dendrobatidis JEL423]|uniref:C2H2-type domain-containing protein n=1 Tax=Batrachochytrium dendrobatidis (strain JEL423) TaxID=403673 RepID=A0A177WML1_BATDL|nr:hypothetical protein BDEG_24728 [Batrachochytrium dendrobatidis JEL423]